MQKKRAVVLLSGGIDSTTTLAVARNEGFKCFCLSFDYGQRHRLEIDAAKRVAESLDVKEHKVVKIDLRTIGGSALTADIAVPKNRKTKEIPAEIPITYVPARNTIFLSYALGWAEILGAQDIFIGVTAIDYSGYPDCRPEYIEAFQKLARLATKAGVEGNPVKIHAPLINLDKAEIIKLGAKLGVDFSLTHSCYDPTNDGRACGRCDSCILRREGFKNAGIPDPIKYA
jgi:7-cyano-7-deazaguanine synthase